MPDAVLANPPAYLRAPVSRGASPRVDRRGGYRSAGIIRGVSVITQGEALGHDLWIDRSMVEQVRDAINVRNKGVKSRFTHPSLSGDGLGKHVGRIMDAELSSDGRQILADQHFAQAAHNTPDGDLATYLMDLADEDPDAYGLSIVFALDKGEMKRFESENSVESGAFRSPDPLNVNNYPHARLAELRAVDAVDEPAANPNGLFHREQDIASEADALAAFALGLTAEQPETVSLGLDPQRVRGFAARFLNRHKLEVRPMAADDTTPAEDTTPADEPVASGLKPDGTPAATEPEPAPVAAGDRSEAARFRQAFGDRGAVWFAEGLSFDAARGRELAELRQENESLKKKMAAAPAGELSPVGFDAGEQGTRQGFASKLRLK